ncbi:MAG: hypothetical protein ACRDT4_16625 [Micromonosporaceae bacterium]
MSVDDIKASADAARQAIQSALTSAQAAMSEANDLAQDAAARGWEGVARTVMAAQSALEAVASSLGSAHDASDGAARGAVEITSQLAPKDIADRAAGVIAQHDQAVSGIDAANGSIGEAYQYAQQVEADRLIAVVAAVADSLSTARQSVEAAKSTARAEHQEAQAWGK